MKPSGCFAAILLLSGGMSQAASFTWDTVSDGSAITYGSGTWNLTNAFWNNGTGNSPWTNPPAGSPANDAIFIGTGTGVGTATIGANALTVGAISVTGTATTVFNGAYPNLTATSCAIQTTGSGKLALTASGTLSNIGAFTIANAATLYIATTTLDTGLSLTGSGNTENLGAIRLDNSGTLLGTVTLTGNATFGSNSGTGIIGSAVSGNFAFNQTSISPGTVRLTGNNTFTGGTILSTGTTQAGHNNAFGTGTLRLNGGTLSSDSTTARTLPNIGETSGSVVLGNATNSGKLTFPASVTATAATTLTAASAVEFKDLRTANTFTSSGPVTLGEKFTALSSNAALAGGPITLGSGDAEFDTNGFDLSITAALAGTAGFSKTGNGILSLGGAASTFSGPIRITAGTLRLVPTYHLPSNLKIMPTGDSITFGANGGYRYPLYTHLQPIAPGFQFVGDSTVGPGPLPVGQRNHAGHSSYSSVDIHNNLDGLDTTTFNTYGGADRNPNGGYWLTGGDGTNGTPNRAPLYPDVILLLVGANDIYRLTLNAQQAHASYTALLTKMTTLRPNAHIFIAKITPHSTNDGPAVVYNAVVGQVYTEFKAAGKSVHLVDLHTGYSGGLPDGLHPDAAGYSWMAGRWRDALITGLGVPVPTDLRNASNLSVEAGATLAGDARLSALDVMGVLSPGDTAVGKLEAATTSISGTYRCDLSGASSDLLAVTGDLNLSSATLALTSLAASASPVHTIVTYTGALTGSFSQVSGLPSDFQLAHDAVNKRLIVAQPYAIWRASMGLPDASATTEQDADHDGAADLLEFAVGGNPRNASSRGIQLSSLDQVSSEQVFTLTIATRTGASFTPATANALAAAAGGIVYRVEGSSTLDTWNGSVAEIPADPGLPTAPSGYEYHAFRIAAGAPSVGKHFLRLQVSEPGIP